VPEPATIRPLRADAARNRARVLEAAAEAFAEGGLEVSVAEIARRAGVGTATLFRGFGTKEDLVVAIVEQRTEQMLAVAARAREVPDHVEALRLFMREVTEMQARDRGLFEALGTVMHRDERLQGIKCELEATGEELLRAAQEAGGIRRDLTVQDLPFCAMAASGATRLLPSLRPALWERYFTVVFDGLRTEGGGRDPLPIAPPTKEEVSAAGLQAGRPHGCQPAGSG
jgi:AcrR family transcriptional regulator